MGDQNSWQWHCFRAKHLYLHIFKTDICRYINIWHISELRIFGSICPCYETRAIFSGGIRLDTVKHWLEIRAGQRRYLSTISTSSERFYLRDYGLWSRARIDSCLIVGSVDGQWRKTGGKHATGSMFDWRRGFGWSFVLHGLGPVIIRAANDGLRRYHNHGEGPFLDLLLVHGWKCRVALSHLRHY